MAAKSTVVRALPVLGEPRVRCGALPEAGCPPIHTWFLWEPENPPLPNAWYEVILQNGQLTFATFRLEGFWWAIEAGKFQPVFWRSASYGESSVEVQPVVEIPDRKSHDLRFSSKFAIWSGRGRSGRTARSGKID